MSIKNICFVALAGLFITACDNNNSSNAAFLAAGGGSSGNMVVTPSLGKMSNAFVQLRKPDGSEFSPDVGAELDADGTATVAVPASHTGPILVAVFANGQTEYFDESSGELENNDGAILPSMSVYLPEVKATVGVTPFTTMARFLLAGDTDITADDINTVNQAIAAQFGLGASFDITQPPVLIAQASDLDALDGSEPARYAAALAALAEVGSGGERPMAEVLNNMIDDIADGVLDAAVDGAPQAFVYADLGNAFSTAAAVLAASLPVDVNLSLNTINLDFNNLFAGGGDSGGGDTGGNGGANFSIGTLTVSGTFALNSISFDIPEVVINNTPVPSATDFSLIEEDVIGQFGASGSVTVTPVTNTATVLSFRVEFSGLNAGQSVRYSLLYEYTAS